MHIPDGYLSPQTDAVFGAVSLLGIARAAYKTGATIPKKYVPMLSIGAAFSFTMMMFNVPIPDGTTAHAVGGSLLAILLGPWPATISVSIALIIQALFFGDGGVLALGANIFNMGIVLPFVSYYIYRLIAGSSALTSARRTVASFIGGYVGLSAAALCAGFEFGIQPILFHTASGTPLYSPYSLSVAIPAMLFAHLLIAGPVEGIINSVVVSYLARSNPYLLEITKPQAVEKAEAPRWRKIIAVLAVLAVLTPLGLLASGTAFGEGSGEDLASSLGYIPAGFEKLSSFWQHTLLPDYGFPGGAEAFWVQALGYIVSAFVGFIVIGVIAFVIQRAYKGKNSGSNSGNSAVAPKN